jgi:hypothetical protein
VKTTGVITSHGCTRSSKCMRMFVSLANTDGLFTGVSSNTTSLRCMVSGGKDPGIHNFGTRREVVIFMLCSEYCYYYYYYYYHRHHQHHHY